MLLKDLPPGMKLKIPMDIQLPLKLHNARTIVDAVGKTVMVCGPNCDGAGAIMTSEEGDRLVEVVMKAIENHLIDLHNESLR
jgi:hypothetical protein